VAVVIVAGPVVAGQADHPVHASGGDPAGPTVVGWPWCRARDARICGVLRGVMTSCNALVYEAIQRVYRNAVVDRIRSGMQAAYPDDYEIRVTSRFGSWADIVSAAAQSAVTGVVAHPIKTSSTISM
jgi:hypothetical protein